MIQAKVFELRDRATFIPIIAVLVEPSHAGTIEEGYLLRRCGYPIAEVNVIICEARGTSRGAFCDPHDWGGRTFPVAHNYIIDNWHTLKDGQVICVEHILGERDTPKESEMKDG